MVMRTDPRGGFTQQGVGSVRPTVMPDDADRGDDTADERRPGSVADRTRTLSAHLGLGS